MKTPKAIWIIWTKNSLQRIQQGFVPRFIFSTREAAREEAEYYRATGFKVQISKYEMSVYLCTDCNLHYCTECEPGEDSCGTCHTGPRCQECAVDHSELCPEPDYCAACGAAYTDGDEDEDFCSKHRVVQISKYERSK